MVSRLKKLRRYNLILASRSPRRQMLMDGLDLSFEIKVKNVKEIYPEDMHYNDVPEFLSKLKAKSFDRSQLVKTDIVITADTIVVLDEKVIGKPKSKAEAKRILKSLSGNKHKVITGVCLTSAVKQTNI